MGGESSWAGGGILSALHPWRCPDPIDRLIGLSETSYPALAESLYRTTGIDPEWIRSGLVIVDTDDRDLAAKWAEKHAKCVEVLRNSRIRRIEPRLSQEVTEALWMPDVAQIRNPRLLAALWKDLLRGGVEIREHAAVTGFSVNAGRLRAIYTETADLPTMQCVVAAGAWTGDLLAKTGLHLPIRPRRGQMLLYRARPGLISHIIVADDHYVIPRRDGHVLVGSTVEDVGFDKSTTREAQETLRYAALDLVPALANCPIESHWAGLRPGSADGIPFIGEHPEIAGLYICSGHFRNGLGMAPASAQLMVDLMLGRSAEVDPSLYRLNRGEG